MWKWDNNWAFSLPLPSSPNFDQSKTTQFGVRLFSAQYDPGGFVCRSLQAPGSSPSRFFIGLVAVWYSHSGHGEVAKKARQ